MHRFGCKTVVVLCWLGKSGDSRVAGQDALAVFGAQGLELKMRSDAGCDVLGEFQLDARRAIVLGDLGNLALLNLPELELQTSDLFLKKVHIIHASTKVPTKNSK